MRKKLLAGVLSLAMAGTLLSGCSLLKNKEPGQENPTETPAETETPAPTETPEEEVTVIPDPPADTPTPTQAPVAPETETKSNNIYVILPDIDEGESGKEAALIKQKAEGYGYQVILCEHDGEMDDQSEYFQQAIRENAQGIICDNAGAPITAEYVAMAKEAGIPTILLNKGIDGEGSAIAQILTDSYSGAKQVGQAFLEKFGNEGLYVELLGDSENINALNATNAFHEVVDASENVFVDRQEIGNEYSEDDAEAKIRSMLNDSPDARGIVCYNGMMAEEAADVAEEMGRRNMIIVCLSADEEAEDQVREGKIFAAAIKPAATLAEMSIEQMHKYLTEGSTGTDEIQYVEGSVIRSDR